MDGITCTTQYTGIFKNRFLPEDGYKYAGLICEYNKERLKICERCAYNFIFLWFFQKGSVFRRNSFKHKQITCKVFHLMCNKFDNAYTVPRMRHIYITLYNRGNVSVRRKLVSW